MHRDTTRRFRPSRASDAPGDTRQPRDKAPVSPTSEVMSVRLTRKYAEMIDGIDLADAHVGDQLKLPRHDAEVLIAEGWAERTAIRPPSTGCI